MMLLVLGKLDGSLPANDRRIANAVTLKSTFCLPQNQQLFKNIWLWNFQKSTDKIFVN